MRHLAQTRNPTNYLLDGEMDSGFALRAPRNDNATFLYALACVTNFVLR